MTNRSFTINVCTHLGVMEEKGFGEKNKRFICTEARVGIIEIINESANMFI